MQVKSTVGSHHAALRMATVRVPTPSAAAGVGTRVTRTLLGRLSNATALWETVGQCQENKPTASTQPGVPTLGHFTQ